MKKLLIILSSLCFIGTTSASVVSCRVIDTNGSGGGGDSNNSESIELLSLSDPIEKLKIDVEPIKYEQYYHFYDDEVGDDQAAADEMQKNPADGEEMDTDMFYQTAMTFVKGYTVIREYFNILNDFYKNSVTKASDLQKIDDLQQIKDGRESVSNYRKQFTEDGPNQYNKIVALMSITGGDDIYSGDEKARQEDLQNLSNVNESLSYYKNGVVNQYLQALNNRKAELEEKEKSEE